MIKVVNVISDTNIGGAGKCLIYFSQNYDKTKFDVSVVLPRGSALIEELKKTSVKLIEIDGLKDKSLDFKAFFKLLRIFKQEKPDIVHTHASSIARLAAKCCKNTKIVYTRHCAYPVSNRIKKGIGHFFYKNMNELTTDKIIAVGNAAEENLIEGGINPEIIDTFFNGVAKVEEIEESEKKRLKEKYHIKENEKVIGIVARLEEVKGHQTFLDAAKILLEEKKINAKFLILGTGSIENELKNKAKELGIVSHVIFTGFVKNVGKFYNIFDVQVNCSYGTETSSLSLLEGMSIGVPAVVSNYGGNPYLIQDGENGYVVPMKSARDFAEGIYRILNNEETKKHMNKRAREIYEENYTVEKYVKNVERVYEEMEREPKIKKINLLDACIILLVLLVCLIGYKYINKQQNMVTLAPTEKVIYTVRTNESLPAIYEMIEEGKPIYDTIKNYSLGKIIKKEKISSERITIDMNTGEMKNVELPQEEVCDFLLTIEAEATHSERNISIDGYIVKTGKDIHIRGKGYEVFGYIVSIER